MGMGIGDDDPPLIAPERPVAAKTESRRTLSTCPSGHSAGAEASLIGRRASKTVSQLRQRYS